MRVLYLIRYALIAGVLIFIVSPLESQIYTSVAGKFTMNFPVVPQIIVDTVPSETGSVIIYTVMASKGPEEAFLVVYSDFPREGAKLSEPYSIINAAKDSAVSNLNVATNRIEKIKLNTYPGLEFDATSVKYSVSYRIYLVENRLYQVAYIRSNRMKNPCEYKKYLESFKLVEVK